MAKSRRAVEQEAAVEEQDMMPQDDQLQQEDSQADFVDDETRMEGDGGTEAAEAISEDSTEEVDNTPSWKRALSEAGFNDFDDPDSAIENTVSAIKQRDTQIEELARQVKFYQDQAKYGTQYAQDQQRQSREEAPAEQEEKDLLSQVLEGWEDPRWAEQYIEVDPETGMRRLRDGIDDVTREKVLATDRKLRQWSEIIQDPRQFAAAVDRRVERMITDHFEKGFEQRQTQQQEKQVVDSFVEENASWLYQSDPLTGQVIRDPLSNEPVLTNQGAQFVQHMQSAAEDGISSVSKQIHYAKLAMGLHLQNQQQASQPPARQTVTDTINQRRKEMQGRRNQQRNTQRDFNGVSPERATEPTGRSSMSFGEETLALMKTGVGES